MQGSTPETPLLGTRKKSPAPGNVASIAKAQQPVKPRVGAAQKTTIPLAQAAPKQTAGAKRIARAQNRTDFLKPETFEQWTGRFSIYCVTTAFNIQHVLKYFRDHPVYSARRLGQDVVHVRKEIETDVESARDAPEDAVWWSGVEDHFNRSAEIFLFSYGVVSTWGLSEGGEWDILDAVKPFHEQAFETPVETELFEYAYAAPDKSSGQLLQITEDVIFLADSLGYNTEDMIRAKLAVSYGMAQSAKLATFETSVDSIFDRVGHLPVIMAQTGKLNLSDNAILKLSGELLAYSSYINLQTDVLDTPGKYHCDISLIELILIMWNDDLDWFWDNETYELLYDKVARYLDVRHRAELVNQRLGVLSDMYALFRDERHILYGHRLEWIVIWLIVIEVVLDLLELAILLRSGI